MTPLPHSQRCETCGHHRIIGAVPDIEDCDICDHIPTYNERLFIEKMGCASHTSSKASTLLITDTHNGKQYTNVYDPKKEGLSQLCIDAGLSDRLTYCDIECLITDGETWYLLDECGNWAYLPSEYKVEVV